MRLRNNIFAEAFKWLKKNWEGIKFQKDLAAKIGVSEDTITRIMRDQTEVTDDFLCKFNEAFDNVFNYQWLRGEDPYHMLASDVIEHRIEQKQMQNEQIDQSSLVNAALAAKDETIKSKDETIASLRDTIEGLKRENALLRQQLSKCQTDDILEHHPFQIGTAEQDKSRKRILR